MDVLSKEVGSSWDGLLFRHAHEKGGSHQGWEPVWVGTPLRAHARVRKPIGGVPKTPPAVLLVVPAVATAAKATTTTARAAKEVARGLRGGAVIVRDDARLVVVKVR